MATWSELEAHARKRARMEDFGPGWLSFCWPAGDGPPVRILLKKLPVGAQPYAGAIAGGCPAKRLSADEILRWSATLPTGCTVVLSDGCLWLHFVAPIAFLTTAKLERMLGFVAREGARLAVDAQPRRGDTHFTALFSGFGA